MGRGGNIFGPCAFHFKEILAAYVDMFSMNMVYNLRDQTLILGSNFFNRGIFTYQN